MRIPRRELFDIRLQIMAEDGDDATAAVGLDSSDIRTNVYEGGFKSWECSFDLAKLLLDRGPRKDLDDLCRVDHVVEVGATGSDNGFKATDYSNIAWMRHSNPVPSPLPLRYDRKAPTILHSIRLQCFRPSLSHITKSSPHMGKHTSRPRCAVLVIGPKSPLWARRKWRFRDHS